MREAAREGHGVSGQDATTEFGKVDGATRHPSASAVAVVRAILARGALVGDKSTEQLTALMGDLSKQLRDADVKISPRYGSGIDTTTSAILQQQPNWLVQKKKPATPAPRPAP